MSILNGGIFSNPRGKTGGVVFGAARTRQGKRVTSRLLVSPSNPNTALQQAQRSIFSYAQDIVRRIGSGIYQVDWNRAIGQLPGFQSMQSIFMKQTSSIGAVSLVTPINLGTLEPLNDLAVVATDNNTFTLSWEPAITGNGTNNDVVKVLVVCKNAGSRATAGAVFVNTSATRSDGDLSVDVPVNEEEWDMYVYAVGVGTASGLISVASPLSVDLAI